jgi:PAS domain S-box-containing protein
MKNNLDRSSRLAALRIIAIYGLFAALWIYFSDTALGLLVQDTSLLVHISVYKGFFFIIVTAALLYQLIVRYIRETRAFEKDLQASRNLISALLEGTTDAIFVKDLQGRYLLFNSAASQVVGKSAADVIGHDDTSIFSPDEAGAIMAGDRRVMDAGRVMTYEDYLTTVDGAKRTFLSTKGPVCNESGEVYGLFGISRDITERKQAEDALLESETKFRTLFERMTQGVFYQNADGALIDANPAALRMFGIAREDFIGRRSEDTHWKVIREDGTPFPASQHPSVVALETGREVQDEVAGVFNPQTGEYQWMVINATPQFRAEETTPYQVFVTMHDITERKESEKAREATIELLRICNSAGGKRELIRELTGFFHGFSGCEAVGVRLKEGDDFPYYESRGFPEEFVLLENSLCAYDRNGELIRDNSGHPLYDCMCGNVLSGRFDPEKPFFTPRGSFWSSCTTELLATTTDEERQAKTRNRCNGEGYESVALVPLATHGEIFGLVQFNDRRRGRFSGEKIALYEELVGYVAITLAKLRAEEALSESSQFSVQIISSAEEGIIVYGRDMRYQVWNPFMERLSGKGADEVIGRQPLECFPFLRESGVMESIRKALAGQVLAANEFPIQSAQTGRSLWVSDTCVPLRNTKGEIIGVIGTVLDVTERRQAEESLKEATQRLQLAVSSGQLGIWDWDIINNLLVWNERMFDLYGIERNGFNMSHEAWLKCLHPGDVAMALEETRRALSGEKEYDFEFRVMHPDGSVRFIKGNARVIRDESGRAVRMTGMNQDVTERKHLEEQLRQSQKMEAIGQLAGGIAHDFNNILTAIYGYCSVLQMKVGMDEPFRPEIDHIYAAAERAANLTRSLLAFSRKQIMTPRSVNLNDIVMNVGKLLTRIIGEDIRLKTEFKANPLMVYADSGQIEQVLMNLAANARDAMPDGGLLTVETEVVGLDEGFVLAHGYGTPGKYAVMSVSDSGKGMDAFTAKKIFEPFFTTKEVGKGTGLGLAIVYGVVKQHSGFVNVYSEPGKGTTFRIYLPQSGAEFSVDEVETVPEQPTMGSETVLVAEDDRSIRELIESVLGKFGYGVIIADDGVDAIDKFKTNREKVDILIMDMVMPKKSGREAYQEIIKLRSDVKVLFISGYSPDLLHNRGFLDTGEDVLVKPFQPLDLVRKVRSVLDTPPTKG